MRGVFVSCSIRTTGAKDNTKQRDTSGNATVESRSKGLAVSLPERLYPPDLTEAKSKECRSSETGALIPLGFFKNATQRHYTLQSVTFHLMRRQLLGQ